MTKLEQIQRARREKGETMADRQRRKRGAGDAALDRKLTAKAADVMMLGELERGHGGELQGPAGEIARLLVEVAAAGVVTERVEQGNADKIPRSRLRALFTHYRQLGLSRDDAFVRIVELAREELESDGSGARPADLAVVEDVGRFGRRAVRKARDLSAEDLRKSINRVRTAKLTELRAALVEGDQGKVRRLLRGELFRDVRDALAVGEVAEAMGIVFGKNRRRPPVLR